MKKEKKDKKTGQKKEGTRQLIGIQEITDYSLRTMEHGELVFFLIHPSNLSVLSESSLAARIYGLMTILKGMAELEMLCLNSKENFEDNKKFIQDRVEEEENSAIRKLLEADLKFLDQIQVQMATAREFILVVRLPGEEEKEVSPYLNRIEKTLNDQGFTTRRANGDDIRRVLAVYFEQNVTTERFEESDGERWVIFHDH